jgi:hypothetical protein
MIADLERDLTVTEDIRECAGIALERAEERCTEIGIDARLFLAKDCKLVRSRDRQRSQQQPVDEREDCGAGADA